MEGKNNWEIDMIINNILVYTEKETFVPGAIRIRDGRIIDIFNKNRIESLSEKDGEETLDGKGAMAIPGLIDLHFHGCMGADFCDAGRKAIEKIATYEASMGITAIAPATMTLPVKDLEEILSVAAEYAKTSSHQGEKADLVGINMEGPFISPEKKGAQDEKNILPCNVALAERFLEISEGLVKFIGLAPEESPDSMEFIREMKGKVRISLAHTNADYDTAKEAFDTGADHAVHLFNAMSPFSHRAPGVVGAVGDCSHVTAELICDGVHLHPSMVRAAFRMLGKERIVLISDSMRATGMPDGEYTLGGLDVKVKGNRATLISDGTLAGSVTNLMDCMKTLVKEMEIPLETAIACATKNPAKCLGIYKERGSLTPGKIADIVLLDEKLDIKAVLKDGKQIFANKAVSCYNELS